MRKLVLLAFLVGCGGAADEKVWMQGDACTAPDCGDMYCTSQKLKDGTTTPPMCEPVCTAGADCASGCCLPLLGFDVWTCAPHVACE